MKIQWADAQKKIWKPQAAWSRLWREPPVRRFIPSVIEVLGKSPRLKTKIRGNKSNQEKTKILRV